MISLDLHRVINSGVLFEFKPSVSIFACMKPSFFKWIQQKGMLLLATTMLLKAFLAPVIFIDFKLNQDYITKVLCINREKPQLECNGQCVLMQKMQKNQESDNPEQSQSSKSHLLEMFYEWGNEFIPQVVFIHIEKHFPVYAEGAHSTYFTSIFHPPRLA